MHIACHGHDTTLALIVDENVFGLNKVRCVSFLVQSTNNKSPARPSIIFPGDQVEVRFLAHLDGWFCYINIAKNARNSEGRVLDTLEFLQKFLIECKSTYVVNTIWISFAHYSERLIVLIAGGSLILRLKVLDIHEGCLHIFG